MKYGFIILLAFFLPTHSRTTYNNGFVEIKTLVVSGEPFGVVKLRRTGNHIKAKYFAAPDNHGASVANRFTTWSAGRNIIACTSGTYTNSCGTDPIPIGLCIDQGQVVNEHLIENGLDALVIVYATGGIASNNLKNGNLAITDSKGKRLILDLRSNPMDKQVFVEWAREMDVTVFQAHLFVYYDSLLISATASPVLSPRRFLAVCRLRDDEIADYIINLPNQNSILDGARKALSYLKNSEEVQTVFFMINFDTGCQDIFELYDSARQKIDNSYFGGNSRIPLSAAANLLVFYYE